MLTYIRALSPGHFSQRNEQPVAAKDAAEGSLFVTGSDTGAVAGGMRGIPKLRLLHILGGCLILTLCFSLCGAVFAHSEYTNYVSDAFFGQGNAEITEQSRENLHTFADKLDPMKLETIIVVGYARASEADPDGLSMRRANAVKFELLQLGVPPGIIYVDKEGPRQPRGDEMATTRRRAEVESIGKYATSVETASFNLMWRWHQDALQSVKPVQADLPADPWANLRPMEFFPLIKNSELRDRFLNRMLLVAILQKDDDLLKSLQKIGSPVVPDTELPPALLAAAVGTPYARSSFAVALLKIEIENPQRRALTLRFWCGDESHANLLEDRISSQLRVEELLTRLPEIEQQAWVWCAAQRKNITELQWLRVRRLDLNAKGQYGFTALHRAVFRYEGDAVKTLLGAGANPNVRDAEGRTPLHAVQSASIGYMLPLSRDMRLPIWNALVDAGADQALKDNAGRTPSLK